MAKKKLGAVPPEPKWAHSHFYTSARGIRHEVSVSPITAVARHDLAPPDGKKLPAGLKSGVEYKVDAGAFETWEQAWQAEQDMIAADAADSASTEKMI